jgi:pilus assembly protein Flp/PilA
VRLYRLFSDSPFGAGIHKPESPLGLAPCVNPATVLHQLLEEFAMNSLICFLRDESGATSIEYAMIASGVAVAIVGAVNNLGSSIKTMWSSVYTALK